MYTDVFADLLFYVWHTMSYSSKFSIWNVSQFCGSNGRVWVLMDYHLLSWLWLVAEVSTGYLYSTSII